MQCIRTIISHAKEQITSEMDGFISGKERNIGKAKNQAINPANKKHHDLKTAKRPSKINIILNFYNDQN